MVGCVETFAYLGRTVDQMDGDCPEVRQNIICAKSV